MSEDDELFEEYYQEFFGGPKSIRKETVRHNKQAYYNYLAEMYDKGEGHVAIDPDKPKSKDNLEYRKLTEDELDDIGIVIMAWCDSLN